MASPLTLGILAHVDAGKTTLSEALLYHAGAIRRAGRVDHRDTFLDTDAMERDRGITIFSKQARLELQGRVVTLLDTPGHVDFSAETERTLQVLDLAVLVVSGTDGIQSHTRTLWRLLAMYRVPIFFFVNKMDLAGADRDRVLESLKRELSDGCVPFPEAGAPEGEALEEIAMTDEAALEAYSENETIPGDMIRSLIAGRKLFPVWFGSALKMEGVEALAEGLSRWAPVRKYGDTFGARVYKIGRDAKGARLTYMKITGGTLSVKELVPIGDDTLEISDSGPKVDSKLEKVDFGASSGQGKARQPREKEPSQTREDGLQEKDRVRTKEYGLQEKEPFWTKEDGLQRKEQNQTKEGLIREKVDQIRLYSGEKFELVQTAEAGQVVAVTGLMETKAGMGLGCETGEIHPVLEAVMTRAMILPPDVNTAGFYRQVKELSEEDPALGIIWDEKTQEIRAQIMGQVQIEILTRLIEERFGVKVTFGPERILYKETVVSPVEGVGHFEPLRHYAEVHLLLEPGDPGSGVTVSSACSTDVLDLNWQRLIATHVLEREHPGVLIGAPLTDVKVTILAGRAHIKHTEGGDFRQATYRAIRQGLMMGECMLLEPFLNLILEMPADSLGRALNDLGERHAVLKEPVFTDDGNVRLYGRIPAACVGDYVSEVHSYTKGAGVLTLTPAGYDACHNMKDVMEASGYDPELDQENPAGSVFCSHGSGFLVPWELVPEYMHLDWVFGGYAPGDGRGEDGPGDRSEAGDGGEIGYSENAGVPAGNGRHQVGAPGMNGMNGGSFSGIRDGNNWSASGARGGNDRSVSGARGGIDGSVFGARGGNDRSVSGAQGEKDARFTGTWADYDAQGVSRRAERIAREAARREAAPENDPELQAIYAREFGMTKEGMRFDAEERSRRGWKRQLTSRIEAPKEKIDKHGNPIFPKKDTRKPFLIVDGYNMIYAWEELKALAGDSLDAARGRLLDLLSNYQGYTGERLAVVFDAYRTDRTPASVMSWHNIEVVFTQKGETADAWIERCVHEDGGRYRITVATSDGLEQLTVLRLGALRLSARELLMRIRESGSSLVR